MQISERVTIRRCHRRRSPAGGDSPNIGTPGDSLCKWPVGQLRVVKGFAAAKSARTRSRSSGVSTPGAGVPSVISTTMRNPCQSARSCSSASKRSIGAGESGVWLISSAHQLLRLDPVTNQVDGQWPLPASAAAVRVGLDAVWVTVPATDTLLQIDPADPTTSKSIKVGRGPRFLAVGPDAVWVMDQADGSVSRVSGAGDVIATVPVSKVPIQGGDITVGGGRVWVRIEQDLVVTIDPATNAVVDRYGPPSGSGSVAVDDDAAWVSAHDTSSVYRLPLR